MRLKVRRHHVEKAVADEREMGGPIVSLAPFTVGSLTCAVPPGMSLAAFRIGEGGAIESGESGSHDTTGGV